MTWYNKLQGEYKLTTATTAFFVLPLHQWSSWLLKEQLRWLAA